MTDKELAQALFKLDGLLRSMFPGAEAPKEDENEILQAAVRIGELSAEVKELSEKVAELSETVAKLSVTKVSGNNEQSL